MYNPETTETIGLNRCHACGAEQRDRDKFCRRCGVSQISRIVLSDNSAGSVTSNGIVMSEIDGLVFVVDDDAHLCESLKNLIRSVGLRVEAYTSAQELLSGNRPDVPGCLVLDVRLPGPSGLDLQKRMAEAGMEIPIIFISAHGDIPMTVQAMKAGAVEFFTKPFRDQDLLDAIRRALARDRKAREQRAEIEGLRCRFASLTQREREVMALMVQGYLISG